MTFDREVFKRRPALLQKTGNALVSPAGSPVSTIDRYDVLTNDPHARSPLNLKRGRVSLSNDFPDGRPSSAVDNKNIDPVRRMIETDSHPLREKLCPMKSYGDDSSLETSLMILPPVWRLHKEHPSNYRISITHGNPWSHSSFIAQEHIIIINRDIEGSAALGARHRIAFVLFVGLKGCPRARSESGPVRAGRRAHHALFSSRIYY
ncbi:hypothetical protein EVAR_83725_1 [Eumeta japonica]|uniref:Uncharacterized protein n=1 Tax=Eumeta variegata TaxID=151549 RepID=A0A4C1WAF0_EUMVA|nr:hypothetical protein EVAR_83725_1 [Eumeta japonica]